MRLRHSEVKDHFIAKYYRRLRKNEELIELEFYTEELEEIERLIKSLEKKVQSDPKTILHNLLKKQVGLSENQTLKNDYTHDPKDNNSYFTVNSFGGSQIDIGYRDLFELEKYCLGIKTMSEIESKANQVFIYFDRKFKEQQTILALRKRVLLDLIKECEPKIRNEIDEQKLEPKEKEFLLFNILENKSHFDNLSNSKRAQLVGKIIDTVAIHTIRTRPPFNKYSAHESLLNNKEIDYKKKADRIWRDITNT